MRGRAALSWSRPRVLLLSLAVEGGMLVLALLLGWLFGLPLLSQLSPSIEAAATGFAATLPAVLAFWLAQRAHSGPLVRLRALVEALVQRAFAHSRTLDLLFISLLAGLGEEALFRGVLQQGLTLLAGPVPGLLLASLAFGLAHALSGAYFVLASLMGAYLGAVFQLSGGLFAPVLVHALYDFAALLYLLRRRPTSMRRPRDAGRSRSL